MDNFTIGKAGNNWIYFTPHDQGEPTHAHANWPKKVESGSAKVWVFRDGTSKVEKWGNVSPKEMNEIQKFLKINHMRLFTKWENAFKVLRIYGEPGVEFIVQDGELIEKSAIRKVLPDPAAYAADLQFADGEEKRAVARRMIADGYRDVKTIEKATWLKTSAIHELFKEHGIESL